MLHSYYFSASNTTGKIVKAIADNLGVDAAHHNMTPRGVSEASLPADGDIALFAAPVYAGRIPAVAAEKFRSIKGDGQKCVAVVVYGNRDYDDALVELCDLVTENGFQVVAAAAFVAQHSIFTQVASGRPDVEDMRKIAEFCGSVRESLSRGNSLDPEAVKGSRPYKTPAPIPLVPKTDSKKCGGCGTCVRECPAGAISIENPRETDDAKCISCGRCIVVCPEEARKFGGLKYAAIAPLFRKKCSARLEPTWFVAE